MQYVDANYTLRYLLNDDKTQAPAAASVIESGTAELAVETVPEIVYVLTGRYGIPRREVAEHMTEFIEGSGILIERKNSMLKAIELFASTTMDFVDCMLAARAIVEHAHIHTFDKKLLKYIEKECAKKVE
jgi:predicted nucleic-acid-binding protein